MREGATTQEPAKGAAEMEVAHMLSGPRNRGIDTIAEGPESTAPGVSAVPDRRSPFAAADEETFGRSERRGQETRAEREQLEGHAKSHATGPQWKRVKILV